MLQNLFVKALKSPTEIAIILAQITSCCPTVDEFRRLFETDNDGILSGIFLVATTEAEGKSLRRIVMTELYPGDDTASQVFTVLKSLAGALVRYVAAHTEHGDTLRQYVKAIDRNEIAEAELTNLGSGVGVYGLKSGLTPDEGIIFGKLGRILQGEPAEGYFKELYTRFLSAVMPC